MKCLHIFNTTNILKRDGCTVKGIWISLCQKLWSGKSRKHAAYMSHIVEMNKHIQSRKILSHFSCFELNTTLLLMAHVFPTVKDSYKVNVLYNSVHAELNKYHTSKKNLCSFKSVSKFGHIASCSCRCYHHDRPMHEDYARLMHKVYLLHFVYYRYEIGIFNL